MARISVLAWYGLAVCWAGLPIPVHTAPLSFDVRAAVNYDDNLNRAERGNQREGDTIFTLGGNGSYRRQIGDNSGLVAKLGFETDLHADVGDLDAIRAQTSLTYLIQPVQSFGAPWFALTAAFELSEYSASDIRDGTVSSLGAEAGKRFTDRIAVRGGYKVRDRDASKALVFEQHHDVFHFIGDYTVDDRLGVYLKYEYLDGGMVTTAPRNMRFRGVTRRFAPDRVFGPDRLAWRIDGHSHTMRLGGKYALAKETSLDIGAGYSQTEADGDNRWHVWNIGMTMIHRFE